MGFSKIFFKYEQGRERVVIRESPNREKIVITFLFVFPYSSITTVEFFYTIYLFCKLDAMFKVFFVFKLIRRYFFIICFKG